MINLNGNLDSESISILDQGVLYGFGLFETMRGYNKNVVQIEDHLQRLFSSAESIAWNLPWTKELLINEIQRCVDLSECSDLYIRLTVTKGDGQSIQPSYAIIVKPYQKQSEDSYKQGWHLLPVSIQKNSTSPTSRLKSLNYLDNILARQEAIAKGANEGLFLNEKGYVAEGTKTNLFIVDVHNILITPNLSSGILPGITRQTIIDIAIAQKIEVQERQVELSELDHAKEIFCTNSLIELMPVTLWNNNKVGNGYPGKMTMLLQECYKAKVIFKGKNSKRTLLM